MLLGRNVVFLPDAMLGRVFAVGLFSFGSTGRINGGGSIFGVALSSRRKRRKMRGVESGRQGR